MKGDAREGLRPRVRGVKGFNALGLWGDPGFGEKGEHPTLKPSTPIPKPQTVG